MFALLLVLLMADIAYEFVSLDGRPMTVTIILCSSGGLPMTGKCFCFQWMIFIWQKNGYVSLDWLPMAKYEGICHWMGYKWQKKIMIAVWSLLSPVIVSRDGP